MPPIERGWWVNRNPTIAKRFLALKMVYYKTRKHLDKLPPIAIVIQPLTNLAFVTRISRPILYLSPLLELERPKDVERIIAHELAHLVLGHAGQSVAAVDAHHLQEDPADNLTNSWGFGRRKLKGWRSSAVDRMAKRWRGK
jgi:hypothetical protein